MIGLNDSSIAFTYQTTYQMTGLQQLGWQRSINSSNNIELLIEIDKGVVRIPCQI
jgi:hypothetical protein